MDFDILTYKGGAYCPFPEEIDEPIEPRGEDFDFPVSYTFRRYYAWRYDGVDLPPIDRDKLPPPDPRKLPDWGALNREWEKLGTEVAKQQHRPFRGVEL